MLISRIGFALLYLLFSNNSSANSPELEWELVTPFKFLTDNKIYSIIRSEYNSLSDYEMRESPSLALERKLYKADFDGKKHIRNGWTMSIATGGYEDTCWNFFSAKYETSGKCSNYIHPNSHAVKVWLKNSLYSGDTKCEWHHGNSKTINYCNESIVIRSIPYPKGLDVKVTPLISKPNDFYTKKIEVIDKLIVGLGDSYASGEGNPDIPAKFSEGGVNRDRMFTKDNWYTPRKDINNYAIWEDRRCHRSLYSYQFKTALLMSLENPKQAITFLSYSCSGAKIENILSEWQDAVEHKKMKSIHRWVTQGIGKEQKTYDRKSQLMPQIESLSNDITCPMNWMGKCTKGMREIDLVLLSIGGNDIGFAKYVGNLALSNENILHYAGKKPKEGNVKQSLKVLSKSYKKLANELATRLPINQCEEDGDCKRVLLTTYPNILNDENGRLCSDDNGAFKIPFGNDDNRGNRIKETYQMVILPLQELQNNLESQKVNWSIVNSHNKAYDTHGICSKNIWNINFANEILTIPHKKKKIENWRSFEPNDYRPYGEMQRWVRLPVDSKLSINLTKWKMDFFFTDERSGIVHPNVYGHSATADANLKLIRDIYAQ